MLNRRADKLELLRIAEAVALEKSIDKELIISSMENGIAKAAKSRFGSENEIKVLINRENGDIGIFRKLIIAEKPENSNIYKGNIAGKDLVFLDAPLFADFISLFSLKGLAQKLKDGGIIFEDFTGRYEFSDKKLRLIDSLIKGSELGVSFDTVMNTDNNYFLTTGTIIPAYTLNTLITNFPIVGDIITAGSPEEGLLGANFKIEKLKDDYDISYNPISVFVPNIIKNFLTD